MARIAWTILAICFLAYFGAGRNSVFAAMSSSNYQIQWDAVGVGVSDAQTSTSYKLRSSFETTAGGRGTSAEYRLDAGYRAGVYDRVVDFLVFGQVRASQVAATNLSSTTITLNSTENFSINDMVLLVQNESSSHISAMGRVTDVTSSTVTVDAWTTDGTMPVIDGNDDYAYELSGNTLSFGQLTHLAVTEAVLGWEVTADVTQGYSVYVLEDQDFTDGAHTINDVADGSVTAGSSEYGARASDGTLLASTFDTMDTAITSTLQQVASRSGVSFSTRDFLTLKVAIAPGQAEGAYSQTLSLIFVGDY